MKFPGAPRARRASIVLRAASVLSIAAATVARAEPTCGPTGEHVVARAWPAPLDRPVTLHVRDLALRDALDRVAAAAGLRVSYSPDGLPLDRSVCLSYDSVAAGEVLTGLLEGTSLSPVPVGDDQVVLAPSAPPRRAARDVVPNVNVLDQVLVMGTSFRAGANAVVTSADVIDRAQLARPSSGQMSLSETLNGAVPGLWVWDQAPSSLTTRYAGLRGASSFAVSYPKVYIDGIEVANPALLTEIDPSAVERVEVIRGPEGAALYGADAMGGVVNIVMRHDAGDPDAVAQLRSTAGMAHSAFAPGPVLVQQHALALRGGSDERTSSLSLNLGSTGSYIPGARSWNAGADAGLRLLGARTMLTGTARLYAKEAGLGVSPFAAPLTDRVSTMETGMSREGWRGDGDHDSDTRGGSSMPNGPASQRVREYTVGITGLFAPDDRWTHSLTVGLDGYELSSASSSPLAPEPFAVDSALLATPGAANRATVRASSVARIGSPAASAVFTVAAEHSTLWQQTTGADRAHPGSRYSDEPSWQSNTGVFSQVEASFHDALFATGGLRLENFSGLSASDGLVSLPMLGAAVVHGFGPVTTKLRASYGKAARSPAAAVRASWLEHEPALAGRLVPEEQSGLEGGLDVLVGSSASFRVTRFDQHAYSLIQPVAFASGAMSPVDDPSPTRLLYALQNVGEIGNRGWELESSLSSGRLSLTGTLSLVDSRVRRISESYTGDLQPGDRMLGIPARSGGLTTSWTTPRWSASISATRVSDWLNYDAVALAQAAATATSPIVGEQLRSFWHLYPGVTRLDATASRDVFQRFTLTLGARNLLDVQRGEPDNLTILPGRTITAGVKASF